MRDSKPASMRRSLVELRATGEPIGLVPLAQRLLAVSTPVAPELPRRVVGMALGRPAASLPDRLQPRDLRVDGEFAIAEIPIEAADWVVVDLETTGLAPTRASILEIGAVRISALQIVDRFETLVRPPTRKLSRRLVPELGRYSLDALCAHFGISNRSRHRALGDADATAIALIDLLRMALADPEIRTVGDLIDLNGRPPRPRKRKSKRAARKRVASARSGEHPRNR